MTDLQTVQPTSAAIQSQHAESSSDAQLSGSSSASKHATHDQELRQRQIAEVAYGRAERRGFAPGHELDDWLEAEREFDAAGASSRD